jgi:GT2 family glycosyltransferase
VSTAPKIAVLGMITKIPVAGVIWQTLHYLLGLRRLGFDAYYVEAHARAPSMMMRDDRGDGAALAASFIDRMLRRFDLGDRWAYEALHSDGRCYGLGDAQLRELYKSAELIINLHGGTVPRQEHSQRGRLVYVETDPVQLQAELDQELPETLAFLEQHCAFFTFAENWHGDDCLLPRTRLFDFRPTRQPVCLDLWKPLAETPHKRFTTVGNWRQDWREITLAGRTYTWSKHVEFEKFLQLPAHSGREFELALSGCEDSDTELLRGHGWHVRDGLELSREPEPYRRYIRESLAEFTAAKEQNVALRSGWFSDRSATYLAAGRPVITQETGFSNVLPTGEGLHSFSTLDEAASAVELVFGDYQRSRRGAAEVAHEYFASDVVLRDMLGALGVSLPGGDPRPGALTPTLRLTPVARRPLRLSPETIEDIREAPLPFGQADDSSPEASVVVVSHDNLPLTRLCVESILANTASPACELIVVDNGSQDGSRAYLQTIARRFANVRVHFEDANRGFPAACNIGLSLARTPLLVLLNNDTIVAPGWLGRLAAHAADEEIALVGAVTNRIGNEAEVAVSYESYGDFLEEARERADRLRGESFDIRMPAMFCVAFRRDVYERLGPLDEGFGMGLLEDDDYAERARRAGYRSVCAEDVLVHHFGEGSLGRLFGDGTHGTLLAGNRRRFEEKWDTTWEPYGRRHDEDYDRVRRRVREIVSSRLPANTAVLVATRGDEELVRLPNHRGWHFPQTPDGVYAGHYPVDSKAAINELEQLRSKGADYFLVPKPSMWWLEHYGELEAHLEQRYEAVVRDDACVVFELNGAS